MSNELRLHRSQTPTFFNKDMSVGILVAALLVGVSGPLSLVGMVAGAVIGGAIGKSTIEKENREGKVVGPSNSMWNKEAFVGGISWGMLASIAVDLVAPQAALANFILTGIATLAGSYYGGKLGMQRNNAEYAVALEQQHGLSKQRVPEVEITRDHAAQIEAERLLAAQKDRLR